MKLLFAHKEVNWLCSKYAYTARRTIIGYVKLFAKESTIVFYYHFCNNLSLINKYTYRAHVSMSLQLLNKTSAPSVILLLCYKCVTTFKTWRFFFLFFFLSLESWQN